MRHPSVHDDHAFHPPVNRIDAAFHLRDHPAGDDVLLEKLHRFRDRHLSDQRRRVIPVFQNAGDIRHHDQSLCMQRTCNARCRRIAVDVVGVPLAVAAESRDHRDISLLQQVHHRLDVHPCDASYKAEIRVSHPRLNQTAVHARDAHGLAALDLQQLHQRLVDLPGQHHLRDVHGLLVRHAQAVDKLRLLSQPVHHVRDFRSAAVHQHHLDPDQPKQHHVLHDLLPQLFADHGVAAVLDHDNFAVVASNIGQGLCQNLRSLVVGKGIHLMSDNLR